MDSFSSKEESAFARIALPSGLDPGIEIFHFTVVRPGRWYFFLICYALFPLLYCIGVSLSFEEARGSDKEAELWSRRFNPTGALAIEDGIAKDPGGGRPGSDRQGGGSFPLWSLPASLDGSSAFIKGSRRREGISWSRRRRGSLGDPGAGTEERSAAPGRGVPSLC
ncbi:hypothetical protein GCWU000341_02420 [Oribacterium sp. oral taxon 078 str. F0262]|nr:hypothetical protein GCWU000341_02420 [Oribacterium sp. oral taxon 078 str. F0262]